MRLLVVATPIPSALARCNGEYIRRLIGALADQPGTEVTVVAEQSALGPLVSAQGLRIVDVSASAEDDPRLGGHDILIQTDPYQPRPVHLPTIVIVHEVALYDTAWLFADERPRLVRIFHKNLLRADGVVSSHPYVLDRVAILEPLVKGKTRLLVSPLPYQLEAPSEEVLVQVRQEFGLDRDRPTLVYPADLRGDKNHWNLLTATCELQAAGRELQLVLTGDTVEPCWATSLADRVAYLGLEGVRFTGRTVGAARSALLRQAALVVQAGLADPDAVTAQEAAETQTPVACAETPGVRAQLNRMGLDVPTFDPYDIDAMASCLAEIIDSTGQDLKDRDRASEVIGSWTWEQLAKDLLGVAMELAT